MSEETVGEIYRCTPRQTREAIVDCIQAGLVPFVQSSPGMGKSTIMRSVAKEFGLKLIDHRLSTSAPEDLTGLPNFQNGRATFSPFDLFPLEDWEIPKGYEGWMVFFDEANSATKMVQAASYKITLDRMVGQSHLHPNTALTMAGNLSTDRALVNTLSTAMQSRLIHIEMQIHFKEWLDDVALTEGYDPRIIAYLSYKEAALMDFKPDHQEKTFCCPRTWEFMNRLIYGKKVAVEKTPLYAGTITSGVAVDFVQFTSVHDQIVKLEDVVRDPNNCPIPHDSPSKWMVITHLAQGINEKNVDKLCTYANRMGLEFRVLFFRTMMVRHPELRHHPAYAKAMSELSQYLHG